MTIAADIEKCGAFWRADPFVQISGVVRGACRTDVERQVSGRVRAIDQGVNTERAQLGDDPSDRQDQRRLAGDVIDQQKAGSLRHGADHTAKHLLR